MSTSFTIKSDKHQDHCIALRFWGGQVRGKTVWFSFPQVLLEHLASLEVVGDNGEATTVGDLYDQADEHEFLVQEMFRKRIDEV